MIGSIIKSWEELETLLDARGKLNYIEDINKILLIQTSRVLKLHDCGLEVEKDKEPMLHEHATGKQDSEQLFLKTNRT